MKAKKLETKELEIWWFGVLFFLVARGGYFTYWESLGTS